ncbi:MAG: sugar ABC transporter substrate-binding protein [Chloroflexi bacterium]|nr:sugar ABC transporter substrate-binding protein [Chloroflexota bacterium]
MKNLKTLITTLTLLVALLFLITACGGQDDTTDTSDDTTTESGDDSSSDDSSADDSSSDDSSTEEVMEQPTGVSNGLDKDLTGITIRMANIGGQPYEAMYEAIADFEAATGATVEIVFLGDGFEIDRYLKTNYASGTEDFDVAWNHTSFMAQYTNFVEPLQSWFSDEELAAFSPAIIDAATIDGNLQLIPRHADISGMHYRTDLFEDADLQAAFEADYGYPLAPPTTLDEMYDMAEFFVNADAIQYGTQFAGKEEALAGRFYEVLVANGGNYFDQKLTPTFNDEAGQMSAQWMRDLYTNGLIPADTPNLLWPEVAQNFCDGNVAFYLEWYGWYSYFQDPESCEVAGSFGIVRGPSGAGGDFTGWAGAHAFSVAKASPNKEAAVQLVKYFTSQEISYEEGKLGLLPVRDDVWEQVIADASASEVALDAGRLEVAQGQISEDFFTPPLFADWISFTDIWYPTLQAILLGDTSVEDGVNKGVADAAQMLTDLGYENEELAVLTSPDIGAGSDEVETTGEAQYAGLDQDLSGVTIRMATIGGQPYEAMYDSISIFEEATGATVEIVFLGDGFEIDRYLKTNYASGTEDFDVAWNHTSFMAQYSNFIEPLQNWFTEEDLAAFSPAIIEAATIDGNLQLIPRHADISGMHYRTDLFEDADLQSAFEADYGYPLAPPATLDEMYDMAEFFVNADAIQYGTQFAGKEEALAGRFYEVLVANGGNYFDADFNTTLNSDAGAKSAQWMQDLYSNGLIPADTPNLLWPEVAQNFCDGNVAFYLEWYGWYSYFQDPESCEVAGSFGIVRGPSGAGDDYTGWAGAHAFSIAKASENKEAAAQLVKFFTSEAISYDEGQLGLLPVRDDVWARVIADASASDVALDAGRLEVAQQQIAVDFFTPPLFADWISFTDTWYPTLQGIILGDMTVAEGLEQGADDAHELLDSFGYYEN